MNWEVQNRRTPHTAFRSNDITGSWTSISYFRHGQCYELGFRAWKPPRITEIPAGGKNKWE